MQITQTGHLLEVLFNEESSKNSFSLAKAQQWSQAMKSPGIQIMVLRSEGSVFCSGGPLKEYAKMTTKEEGVQLNAQIRECLTQIAQTPCLKIALVTGDCFGGGVEVLSVCDVIYSLDHVFLGLWQSRLHLSFGWGGWERLSQKMNPHAVKLWLSEGRTHSAFWCQEQGLIQQILSLPQMEQKWVDLQQRAQSPRARYLSTEPFHNEAAFFEELWWSEEHRRSLLRYK